MATNNLPTTWKRAKFILNTTPELFMNWLDRRTLSRALSGNDEGNEPKRDFILGGEHYILGTTNGIASVRNGTNIIATTSIRLERFGTNSYKGPTVIKFYTDFIRPTELEVIIEWLDFSELAVWVNKLLEDIEQRWPEAALSRPPQIENGFLMRKPTLTLIEQSDNFGKRLELFRQDKLSDYKLLNKGNGRYQIRNNDSLMLEIQALPKEKDRLGRNQLELYLACPFEGMDVYEIFYDWVSHTYEGKFNSYIDEVTFPVQRITHALIEGFAKQETDNPQDEAIRQRFANIANKGLPDLPHDNVAASSQAESNEASGNKEISLATPNESGFESEMRSKDTFTPRFIACHGLPSNPYEYPLMEPPDWEWKPPTFLDVITKIKSLKAMASPFSEQQQRYNDITAKGRQREFEKEIEWLWGSDISTLMEQHDLTEEDMIISNRTLKYEEDERMNKARATAGKWVDPPELESPPEFWARQGLLAAKGQAGEMQKEQEIRKVWLKVYEELAELYETIAGALPTTPMLRLAGGDELGLVVNDLKSKSKRGPRKYSKAEKIAARKEWDELDRDANPITLEKWLENKFGYSAEGILNVPKSTFYGWPKS